jgi:hypothetical protein
MEVFQSGGLMPTDYKGGNRPYGGDSGLSGKLASNSATESCMMGGGNAGCNDAVGRHMALLASVFEKEKDFWCRSLMYDG